MSAMKWPANRPSLFLIAVLIAAVPTRGQEASPPAPPTAAGPAEVQRVAPQVLNIDLRQLTQTAPIQFWFDGQPVKVVEDLRESGEAPPPAPQSNPPAAPPGGPDVQPPVAPQDMAQDMREMPPTSEWKPGDTVRLVQDLRLDAVLQMTTGAPPIAAGTLPIPGVRFDGIPATGFLPPDTVGDVGPNHYVQMVNSSIAIYNKSGTLLAGPVAINSFWAGFGGPCSTLNNGDPIVRYDAMANRWLISQFAVGSSPFFECVAVSKTADPVAGGWYLYGFSTGTNFPDYPKIGVWPDAYYMFTQRGFPSGGMDVWAFERSKMLTGAPANVIHFPVSGTSLILLPSDLEGAVPPAGTPNYFVRQVDGARFGGVDRIDIFAFQVNWATPAKSSTFTALPSLNVAAFDSVLCNTGLMGECVPQPGTPVKLETLTVWTMWRAQYRNFGAYQTIAMNHTVDANGADLAGVRWYELRRPTGGSWSLFQQGTYAPDSVNRWMGSAAIDGAGNLAVGYSVSNTSVFPGLRAAVRKVSDPLGTLTREITLVNGGGSQTYSSAPRWGNYSTMDIDPVNNCTFWYTSEYYSSTSQAGWRTSISSFTMPNCSGPRGTFLITNAPIASFGGWSATANVKRFVGDFNGDGRSDIGLLGGSGWTTIPIAFSNGDGTFNVTNLPINSFNAWASTANVKLLVGDVNGDGRSDIVLTGGSGWTTLPVAFSNGNGTFTVTNNSVGSFGGWAATANVKALIGDISGDGKSDIVLTGGSGWTTLPVARSVGAGTFTVTNNSVGSFGGWAATANVKALIGDISGDGKSDIALTGGSGWTTLPVAMSVGTGTFTVTNNSVGSFGGWAATANAVPLIGDFTGDGKADVALTGASGWTTLPLATSNGPGTFTVTNNSVGSFGGWSATANVKKLAGDFNADGKMDVALTGGSGWTTLPVAFSTGAGVFSVTNLAVSNFGGWAATAGANALLGDYDGSGKKDIALTGPAGWQSVPVAFSISQ